jgi:hypothetical protein
MLLDGSPVTGGGPPRSTAASLEDAPAAAQWGHDSKWSGKDCLQTLQNLAMAFDSVYEVRSRTAFRDRKSPRMAGSWARSCTAWRMDGSNPFNPDRRHCLLIFSGFAGQGNRILFLGDKQPNRGRYRRCLRQKRIRSAELESLGTIGTKEQLRLRIVSIKVP